MTDTQPSPLHEDVKRFQDGQRLRMLAAGHTQDKSAAVAGAPLPEADNVGHADSAVGTKEREWSGLGIAAALGIVVLLLVAVAVNAGDGRGANPDINTTTEGASQVDAGCEADRRKFAYATGQPMDSPQVDAEVMACSEYVSRFSN